MGGIGKTQTALEYVYRHRDSYAYVFWVNADSQENLASGYTAIAEALNLSSKAQGEQEEAVAVTKRWLENNREWLLVLDNADDVRQIRSFLPGGNTGHVLLTTRAQALGTVAHRVEILKMPVDEGVLFLLRRAKFLQPEDDITAISQAERDLARTLYTEMDGLPLALDQAGAYIEERFLGLEEYLELFQMEKAALLQERGELASDHPSVTVTFLLAFQKVVERSAAAADLIRVCAFLSPDDIPEEIFTEGASELGDHLSSIGDSKLALTNAIAEAAKFSLIDRNRQVKTLSIHRLVQEVLIAEMEPAEQAQWADGVIKAVNKAFPYFEFADWDQCDRILPQAQKAFQLINHYGCESQEASRLLNNAGLYLHDRGRYTEAESLLKKNLDISVQISGDDISDIALSFNNLAELYRQQGRYEEAEPLYLRALELGEQVLGEGHPNVILNRMNLAGLYYQQGRYEEAEPLLLRALELGEPVLGEGHPNVILNLNNLAALYYQQGRYGEAEPLYLRALELGEPVLGEGHPNVIGNRMNLAGLYSQQGRYEEAEALSIKALTLRRQVLGEAHPDVATSLNNLAYLYQSQNRYSDAESLYIEALPILFRRLGQDHPNSKVTWSNFVECLHQALEAGRADSLSDHPTTQSVLAQLKTQRSNPQNEQP